MISTTSHTTARLTYAYLDDTHIHLMRFHQPSREAYDEFIQVMDTIYQSVTAQDMVCVLVDYRESGIPPINYTITRGIAWARSLTIHPTARMAVVIRRDPIARMLSRLVSTVRFGHLSTRIFEQDSSYEQAVAWLQSEGSQRH